MSQKAARPEDVLLDVRGIDLRRLDELGDTVLARALDAVLATAEASAQALAGFNSRLPKRPNAGVGGPAGRRPVTDTADTGEE